MSARGCKGGGGRLLPCQQRVTVDLRPHIRATEEKEVLRWGCESLTWWWSPSQRCFPHTTQQTAGTGNTPLHYVRSQINSQRHQEKDGNAHARTQRNEKYETQQRNSDLPRGCPGVNTRGGGMTAPVVCEVVRIRSDRFDATTRKKTERPQPPSTDEYRMMSGELLRVCGRGWVTARGCHGTQ